MAIRATKLELYNMTQVAANAMRHQWIAGECSRCRATYACNMMDAVIYRRTECYDCAVKLGVEAGPRLEPKPVKIHLP